MRFIIEPPSLQEAVSVDVEEAKVAVVPLIIKNNPMVRVGHLKAVGDGGAESRATIYFNGRTGSFSLVSVASAPPVMAFDKSKEEFEKGRDSAKRNGERTGNIRKRKRPEDETNNEAADQNLRGDTLVRAGVTGSLQRAPAGADAGESGT